MDLNNPKKINKKFDTIIAGDIIEHLDNPKNFIKFCFEHLNTNGRFILTTPNAIGLQYIINPKWCIFEQVDCENHINSFTMPMLEYLLNRENFEILKKKHINTYWHWNPIRIISFIFKRIRPGLLIVGKKKN